METLVGAGAPSVVFIQGNEEKRFSLDREPFSIGRRTEKTLVIPDPRVSRDHATIVWEPDGFYLVDEGSRHGTYLNGDKVEGKKKLRRNDRVEFGYRGEAFLVFDPDKNRSSQAQAILSQLSVWKPSSSGTSDLETLTLFLEAARKLNTSSVLDEILITLIDATLRLTKSERGYVFLLEKDGSLRLAAGRNARGEALSDDTTISRSILKEAVSSESEFLLTDTEAFNKYSARESIVAHNLRMVICIPLRRSQVQDKASDGQLEHGELRGILYLDSKYLAGKLSAVSHDILRTIATEAAGLLENAYLVQQEEIAKRVQQEMGIAASIQQRLMRVTIPDVPYAKIQARNIPSKDVGGDFFDLMMASDSLYFVLADVSGKGISAALLASILQGMVYAQLSQGLPLADVLKAANKFVCDKMTGEKYATMVVARLKPDGELEYANCGHIRPIIVRENGPSELDNGNLPVGLIDFASYETASVKMQKGDRLILVSDGVTEAENPDGDFFTPERLNALFPAIQSVEDILQNLLLFCAGTPFNDDCTVMQVEYSGEN